MWATHRGLSKPCANRASCPSPVLGSRGAGRCEGIQYGLHLQIQEVTEQNRLLAVLASTAETQGSAEMVALGAASLAEVAHVARGAFVDGVRDECGAPAESRSKEPFLQVWQGGMAQTKSLLAALIGAKATTAAPPWIGAHRARLWGVRLS